MRVAALDDQRMRLFRSRPGWEIAFFVSQLMGMLSRSVVACPLCNTDTGRQVQAGIFNESFWQNMGATFLPFACFIAVVALIHYGDNGHGDYGKPYGGSLLNLLKKG